MKVLIVDDNSTHRLIFRKWIEGFCPNYTVIEAINADAAMETIVKESPACVLLDYIMIGDDGFQTLHRMKRDLPNCPPVIFLTLRSHGRPETECDGFGRGRLFREI